jgi:hypothetical protein
MKLQAMNLKSESESEPGSLTEAPCPSRVCSHGHGSPRHPSHCCRSVFSDLRDHRTVTVHLESDPGPGRPVSRDAAGRPRPRRARARSRSRRHESWHAGSLARSLSSLVNLKPGRGGLSAHRLRPGLSNGHGPSHGHGPRSPCRPGSGGHAATCRGDWPLSLSATESVQCPAVKGHGFDSDSAWQPEGPGPGVTVKSGPLAPTVTRDPLAAVTGCRGRRLCRAAAPRPPGGRPGPGPGGRPRAALRRPTGRSALVLSN